MALRERFAQTDRGWRDEYTGRPVDIDLMPPEIRAEYAKHDYHPRWRDIKAMIVGTFVLLPLMYAVGGAVFVIFILCTPVKKEQRSVQRNI